MSNTFPIVQTLVRTGRLEIKTVALHLKSAETSDGAAREEALHVADCLEVPVVVLRQGEEVFTVHPRPMLADGAGI